MVTQPHAKRAPTRLIRRDAHSAKLELSLQAPRKRTRFHAVREAADINPIDHPAFLSQARYAHGITSSGNLRSETLKLVARWCIEQIDTPLSAFARSSAAGGGFRFRSPFCKLRGINGHNWR